MAISYACGNIYIRTSQPMAEGDSVPGHEHNFDHAMLVTKGGYRIEQELGDRSEAVEVWEGELPVLVKAGIKHRATALANGSTYMCLFAHRTPQGEVVQRYNGWTDAYN